MSDYALVQSGAIVRLGLPQSARRLDTGGWVLGLADAPDDFKAACGYLPIIDVAAPTVADTEIAERSVGLVNGSPSVVWTVRLKTAEELNPPKSPDERLAAAKATLAVLDALPTPILTADVVDLLDDLRSVL